MLRLPDDAFACRTHEDKQLAWSEIGVVVSNKHLVNIAISESFLPGGGLDNHEQISQSKAGQFLSTLTQGLTYFENFHHPLQAPLYSCHRFGLSCDPLFPLSNQQAIA